MRRLRSFKFAVLLFDLAVALPAATGQAVIATVPAGTNPYGVAINTVTNKTYVPNTSCPNLPCSSPGTVTVIDGSTNNTTTVVVGYSPGSLSRPLAVNPVTNKIYVANNCGNDPGCNSPGTVTVIDGATNNTTTINVDYEPRHVAVNRVTDKIYVVNSCFRCTSGTITVIDGPTNSTTTVNVGFLPSDVEVNP